MQDHWNGQFVQYYTLYVLYLFYELILFYMFDKIKRQKMMKPIVTRKVTELCDEWSHSNQHDQ